MRKHYALLTAATLAVAGITVPTSAQDNQERREPVSQQPAGALLEEAAETDTSAAELRDDTNVVTSGEMRADDKMKVDHRSAKDAQSIVIDTTNAIIASPNDLDDLTEHFTKKDKERLGEIQTDELEPVVAQLRRDFREKYDQDLRFSADEVALFQSDFIQYNGRSIGQAQARVDVDGDARVAAGTDTELNPSETSTINQIDPQRQQETSVDQDTEVTHRTGDAPGAGQQTRAQAHVQTGGATDDDRALTAGAEVEGDRREMRQAHEKMDKGALTIREHNELSAVHLPLVKEGNDLKIDLNDDVRGDQLADNLTTHLRQASENKDQWPSDANQAKQQIVHHVLLALSGDHAHSPAMD